MALDETLIPFIQKQFKTKHELIDSTFTLVLADQSKYPYPGKVFIVDRAVDPQTATLKVRLEFPNPDKLLRSGMSVNVHVLNNSGLETILIPYRSVVEQMAEYFVYVANADTVSQRKIFLGQQIRDMVVVRDGLKPDEQIVLDGVQKLKNGSKIKVAPPSAAGKDSLGRAATDSSKRKSS